METFICEDCGNKKPIDEARQLDGGGAVCDDCADSYASCDECSYYFPEKKIVCLCRGCLGGE